MMWVSVFLTEVANLGFKSEVDVVSLIRTGVNRSARFEGNGSPNCGTLFHLQRKTAIYFKKLFSVFLSANHLTL